MTIVFAAGVGHAPGSTAWAELAPEAQRDAIYGAYGRVRDDLAASGAEAVVIFTSEHWTNFFFENMPSFCVGRADALRGQHQPELF